jgi:hypothetical protein
MVTFHPATSPTPSTLVTSADFGTNRKAKTTLTNSPHHHHFVASTHIAPIHPCSFLELDECHHWVMFDTFLHRIANTKLKCGETLLALFSMDE